MLPSVRAIRMSEDQKKRASVFLCMTMLALNLIVLWQNHAVLRQVTEISNRVPEAISEISQSLHSEVACTQDMLNQSSGILGERVLTLERNMPPAGYTLWLNHNSFVYNPYHCIPSMWVSVHTAEDCSE